MMFFLARSALCIGVVAAAAGGLGTGPLATAIDRGAREAADGLGRACLASADCLRAGTAALSAATGSAQRVCGGEPTAPCPIPRGSEAGFRGESRASPPRASGGSPDGPAPHRPEAGPVRKTTSAGG